MSKFSTSAVEVIAVLVIAPTLTTLKVTSVTIYFTLKFSKD